MRQLPALFVLFAVTAMATPQVPDLPKVRKGELYSAVRIKMLKTGWKPFHSPEADECSGDERCLGRPEMVSCSGTGRAFCKFLWKKGRRTVGIVTTGERAEFSGFQK